MLSAYSLQPKLTRALSGGVPLRRPDDDPRRVKAEFISQMVDEHKKKQAVVIPSSSIKSPCAL